MGQSEPRTPAPVPALATEALAATPFLTKMCFGGAGCSTHTGRGRGLGVYDNLGPQELVEWSAAKHDRKKIVGVELKGEVEFVEWS